MITVCTLPFAVAYNTYLCGDRLSALISLVAIRIILGIRDHYRYEPAQYGFLVLVAIFAVDVILIGSLLLRKGYTNVKNEGIMADTQRNMFHQELTFLFNTLVIVGVTIFSLGFGLLTFLWVYNPGLGSIDAGRTRIGLTFLVSSVVLGVLYFLQIILPVYIRLKEVRDFR